MFKKLLYPMLAVVFAFIISLSLTACSSRTSIPGGPNYNNIPRMVDYPNQPDGFDGIKWGTSFEEAQYKKSLYKTTYGYQNPGASTELFGVKFPEITYSFDEFGEFSAIETGGPFKDPDKATFNKLYKAIVERHGPPTQVMEYDDGNITVFKWCGTKTYIGLSYIDNFYDKNRRRLSLEIGAFYWASFDAHYAWSEQQNAKRRLPTLKDIVTQQ